MARASFLHLAAVTLGAHGALAAGILSIDARPRPRPPTVVAFVSPRPKPSPKPPVVEAPPPLPAAKAAPPRVQNTPVSAPATPALPIAPPAAAAPAPDFGVTLGGGGGNAAPGPGNGAGGSPGSGAGGTPGTVETSRRVLGAPPKVDACDEPPGKPKALAVPQPAYTEAARAAGIAGRVRVEITVDERGHVARVRVLEGLGYGLDEAALASARAATFEPALRCGKPVSATFTVAMRFAL